MAFKVNQIQSGEPVSLDEAKTQLVLSHDLDDVYIKSLISVARTYCENYCFRHFVRKSGEEIFNCFTEMHLDGPLIEVSSIQYCDVNGDWQTLDAAVYKVFSNTVYLRMGQSWPVLYMNSDCIKVTYIVGEVGQGNVPDQDISGVVGEDVKHAIKLLVTHWYGNRSAANEKAFYDIAYGVEALLANSRARFL